MAIERVVVVVPAHNEADDLPRCLSAVATAAARLSVPVLAVLVLDACDDESALVARRFGGVHVLEVERRNVGAARAAGFEYARSLWAESVCDESRVWYATTDADSRVDADWLVRQTESGADVVLGVVRVGNWRHYPAAVVRRYLAAYRSKSRPDGTGHGHVHGANMGLRADVYWTVGGFAAMRSREDVDLVERCEEIGSWIDRDSRLSVETSARPMGKAPRGFAAYLRSMSAREDIA